MFYLGKKILIHLRWTGKIVVVLDILFATTTIVSALNNGINSVVPAFNAQDAREKKKDESNANKILLAGELYADTIEGFAPPHQ